MNKNANPGSLQGARRAGGELCAVMGSAASCDSSRAATRRIGVLRTLLAAAGAVGVAHTAHAGGVVRAWGWNTDGQCNVPFDIGGCIAVGAGHNHTLAVKEGGAVKAWGRNTNRQCTVPQDLGPCTAVAAGWDQSVALRLDGGVRAWGSNNQGQCNVPNDLGTCKAIAAGAYHTVALRVDGGVRVWGYNGDGQCNVPNDLGACKAIASGLYHLLAVKADGNMAAWGAGSPNTSSGNNFGQSILPADLGPCKSIAGGAWHTLVLRVDGVLQAWGDNRYGQCNIPRDMGASTAIAAGALHNVVLEESGIVRAWGDNSAGQCAGPTEPVLSTALSAGYFHNALVQDSDCNTNGVRDSLEFVGHDCNQNGLHDSCDAQADLVEDCNSNGLGDTCEKELTVSIASGHLGPIGFNFNQTWTIPAAVRAESPVTLVIHGHGDFSGLQEYVRVKVGYGFDEHAIQNTMDCENGTGTPSTSTFTLTPEQFNAAIGADGALRVVMEPSIAVDAYGCNGGTWIEASLEYIGALPADCNANGLLDSCEIAAGYGPDVNHNGVVDTCESLILPCPTDFNQNGRTDGADLGMLLSAWGASNQPGLDLDRNGRIDGADLGMLLSGWGPCVQ